MFHKTKIKTYLLTIFSTIIVLATIICALGVAGLLNIRANTNVLTNQIIASSTAVKDCRIAINSAARDLREMIIALSVNDTQSIPQLKSSVQSSLEEVQKNIDLFAEIHGTADGLSQKYQNAFDNWTAIASHVMEHVEEGNVTEAADAVINECSPALAELRSISEELDSSVSSLESAQETTVMNNLRVFIIVLIVFFVLALGISLYVAFNTTYQLNNVLSQIYKAADDLSQGKLNAHVEYDGANEFGKVARRLNFSFSELNKYISAIDYGMSEFASGNFSYECPLPFQGDFANIQHSIENFQDKLCVALGDLGTSAAQVNAGSDQVADGAQALAQGATEQASSVEELSAAISEITSRINDTAEFSRKANQLGQTARETVTRGKEEMAQLLSAIRDIAAASNNIQSIIKVIDDIAFQTNILALNAAVEAARAGNAGKGFAVVADEVRSLAQKSADAAQETTGLIKNSLQHVSRGEDIAHRTDTAFNDVATSAEDILTMIEKIAHASSEQADAISQISVGIDQISSVVQTNSATAEESAAASQELSSQASLMKNLLDQFRLKGVPATSAAAADSRDCAVRGFQTAGYVSDKY
ncbi:methyl-accepting chemotaxis protein [Candidatus Avoscillospira sp. LCP25S3_F1]|uniref:methyl-accepting chemotaxis protein n=1 Tax=Candidatus Avoscillospira sp. LCP25S3_F1 TaxID=3438825 RepID=UPI003F91183E